jgi:hypothetical protein
VGEQREIGETEAERDLPGAEGERQQRDFHGDHQIVRMTQETIGPAPDPRGIGQGDHPGGPAVAQADEDPEPAELQQAVATEQPPIGRHLRRHQDQ